MKEKLINAILILINEYSDERHIVDPSKCSLCILYTAIVKGFTSICKECINNSFRSEHVILVGCLSRELKYDTSLKKQQKKQAEFWTKALAYIRKVPEQHLFPPSKGVAKRLNEIAKQVYLP